MKLHETLKEAGNIIEMLEARNFTPKQMVEITNITTSILQSKIASDGQQTIQEKVMGKIMKDMEDKFKTTKKQKTPFPIPSSSQN